MRKMLFLAELMLLLTSNMFDARAQQALMEWVTTLGRGTIRQSILSADGERIAAGGSQGVWIYDDQLNDLAYIETGSVQRMAWSTDDLFLAVVTEDSRLIIWNMVGYQLHTEIEFSDGPIAWKPNSHLLAMGSQYDISLWNTDTSAFEDILPIATENYKTDLAWSPDGVQLAVAAAGELQLWDLQDSVPKFQLDLRDNRRSGRRPVSLSWSPDGTSIAIVEGWRNDAITEKNTLSIINAETGEMTLTIQAGLAADVAWSPDGNMIATATAAFGSRLRTPINVWDVETGKLMAELIGHTREAHTVQWHSDGRQLLSAAHDNTLRVWQVQPELAVNQVRSNRILLSHMDRVNTFAWSPDSTHIATGSKDGSIRVWEAVSGQIVETSYESDLIGIQALDYSPDGQYLAAGGGENWVRIWGLTEDSRFGHVQYEHGRSSIPGAGNPVGITAVSWSPDSSMLASAGYDALVKLWQVDGDVTARTLRQGGWYALSLHWFVDGERLLIGTRGPEIWSVVAGEQLPLECNGLSVVALELSPDGRYLLVMDDVNGGYSLCDLHTGEIHTYVNNILDWHPMHSMAVGKKWMDSTGQQLILFDPLTSDITAQATIAEFSVNNIVRTALWSPDGSYLAVGLDNGEVQLWRYNALTELN